MDAESISLEIVKIRGRLREIEAERERVADDDLVTKTDRHDEELELKARLAELQEMTAGEPTRQGGRPVERSRPEEYISPT